MAGVISFTVNLGTLLIDLLLSTFFFCKLLHRNPKRPMWFILIIRGIIQLSITHFLLLSASAHITLCVIADYAFVRCLFDNTKTRSAGIVALYYCCMSGSEMIVMHTLSLLTSDFPNLQTVTATQSLNTYAIASYIISRILYQLILVGIMMMRKNPTPHKRLITHPMTIHIATMVLLWAAYPILWQHGNADADAFMAILSVFILLTNILIFFYFYIIRNASYHITGLQKSQEVLENAKEEIVNLQEDIRKRSHSLRHFTMSVRTALLYGDLDRAMDCLNEIENDVTSIHLIHITGNMDVDALLFMAQRQANQVGVDMRFAGLLPEKLSFPLVDLSNLIGTAIDNAIEAASKCNGRRVIQVDTSYRYSQLTIRIVNPYNGRLNLSSEGRLLTSKEDGGHGIEMIREITAKYDGYVRYEYDDDTFTLIIIIQDCREQLALASET